MTENLVSTLRARHQATLEGIAAAAVRSGRNPGEVRLVVVSKSQPLATLQAAVEAGIRFFGENYAEEAMTKISAMTEVPLEWHMIGHVQSRKADLIPGNFCMLHSLDSLKLAGKLQRACLETNQHLPVLLECNVSGEQSKYGFPAWEEQQWPALADLFQPLVELTRLNVQGLMTMPPFFNDPEQTRPYFRKLHRLQEFLVKRLSQMDWHELSMGTSVDHLAAVEEGATLVRVGEAILGARQVKKE